MCFILRTLLSRINDDDDDDDDDILAVVYGSGAQMTVNDLEQSCSLVELTEALRSM